MSLQDREHERKHRLDEEFEALKGRSKSNRWILWTAVVFFLLLFILIWMNQAGQ